MTHTELIEQVADAVGSTYEEAHGFIQTFIDIVIEHLDAQDEIKIRGLGTFHWVKVASKRVPSIPWKFRKTLNDEWKAKTGVVKEGFKLKFLPSTNLRKRRYISSRTAPVFNYESFRSWKEKKMANEDEGMTKYAVVTEDSDEKTASDKTKKICPICGETLDNGGACPVHGTEPFEPNE